MNIPLASCICVTYNREKTLKELLYCFLQQDYENKELIIINDQKNIEYNYNDSRVKIFNLKERFPSLGAKRNYSRDLVNGDYVFIMDDDDIYYSNHISRHIEQHQQHPDFDIVTNINCEYSEEDGGEILRVVKRIINVPFNGTCITSKYYKSHYFPHYISCGEDAAFIETATIYVMKNDVPTFHYRWGSNVHHISGIGGTGIDSYEFAGKLSDTENRKIELIPELTEKTKKYFK